MFTGTGQFGADRITDYNAAQGDILDFGRAGATAADFRVTYVADPGIGQIGVKEVHVTYVPTGKLIWLLYDGAADSSIMVHSGTAVFDLL